MPCADVIVFGSIAGAMVAWAIVEVRNRGRVLWTAGAALAVIHSAAAFHEFHGWSHAAAFAATARQTADVTGVVWGGGLFINYAFLVAWLAHAGAWWTGGTQALGRTVLDRALRGFLFFMFLNGGVVFADGGMRILGVAAIGAVTVAWLRRGLNVARWAS